MAQGTGVFRGDQQAGDFSKVYNTTAAKLKPHLPLVQEITRLLEAGMTGKPISTATMPDQTMDPQVFAANKLMDLPPAERDLVIAAIMSKTGQVGEASDKAGKYNINPLNIVDITSQTGESFARTLTDMYGTNEVAAIQRAREDFAKAASATTTLEAVTTPEEARAFIKEQVYNRAAQSISFADMGVAVKLPGEERKLSIAESALVSKELARAERSARVVAQMGEAARSADPVKNLYASTIGSSLATLPVAMIPGGVALSAAGYANAEDKQLALDHPEMSSSDRATIAGVSGVVMGSLDKITAGYLTDKMPSLRNLISMGVSNAVMKRMGVRALELTVVENAVEWGQDITTATVQELASRMSNDIPDVDWDKELVEFWGSRADVAIGMIPLTLFGVGVATAKDINGARTMLSNNRMLEQAGVLEEDRRVIVELAAANKLEESQAALREAWTRRSREVATAALPPEQVQAQAGAVVRFNALEQAGVAPTFTKTQNGWAVRTPDGKEVQAESWAEAQQIAGQHMADTVARDIEDSAKLADFFVSQQREGMNESVLIAPAEQGGKIEDDTSITEEQAMDRAKIGAIMAGMSPEEAARETQFILGKNVSDFQGGVAESASKLFQGANVTTVVEEVVEGRIKAGLQLNRYTPAGLRKMVDLAEQATGEKFLASETEQGLLEAVSAIAVAEVLNIRKDGSKLPAGVVTRGMMTAVEGVAEKKEGKRLMAMMHAFRTFFRQVFARAKALRKAKAEGKLGADYQSFMDELLGIDPAIRENNAVANEAMQIAAGVEPAAKQKPAPDLVGSIVNFQGYTGRLAKEGERFVVETPDRVVELTAEDVVGVEVEGDLAKQREVFIAELGATDVNLVEAKFTPRTDVLGVERNGEMYVPQNRKLSKSVVDTESGPALRLRSASNKIILVQGKEAQQAIDALLESAAQQEQQGRKVSFATAPAKFMDAVQKKLDEELQGKPYQRVSFYEEVKKRFAKVADDTNKLAAAANATRTKADIDKERQRRADARYAELVAELVAEQAGRLTADDRKAIQKQANKEAKEWADSTIATQDKASPSDLARVQGFIRTLNAGLMGLPPKMRGKIGGMLALSKSTTPAAALKVIEARLEKMGEVVEAELQKEYREQIKDTINAGRVQGGAGDKPKSKTGADTSALFELVAQAVGWDEAQINKALGGYKERLLVGSLTPTEIKELEDKGLPVPDALTPEQEQAIIEEMEIVELVGDIANADSNRLAAINDTLGTMLREGKLVERMKQEQWRALIDNLKQQLTTATGIENIRQARLAMESRAGSKGAVGRDWLLSISSNGELLTYLFGDAANQLIDMERKADYALHDINHNMEKRVGDFFNKLVGAQSGLRGVVTTLTGVNVPAQKLGDMMATEKNVRLSDTEMLTQNQAIHFLMTWRQPAGRRHMEGKFVEINGVIAERVQRSEWAYTQKDADAVQAQLTPEAQALMDFLTGEYAAEFDLIDGLYQERYGVKIPRNPFYSPMDVASQRVSMDESTQPLAGKQVTDVSMVPNSLRTRSTSAINEPRFNDAVQLYLHHAREINHWVAMYDYVKTMRAVFGNRKMMDLVEAKGGRKAGEALRLRIKIAVQGGVNNIGDNMPIWKFLSDVLGRVTSAALLGRVSTLLVQTTQLAAAGMKMPTTAFLYYKGKLMSGQLGWTAAFNSDFIQRRIQQKSPLVRQMMQDLASAKKPGEIKAAVKRLSGLLSDTDGFMTAATYNMLYHFHFDQARARGTADPEAYAANEAERITEEVAQPVRQANRSLLELTATNPLAKSVMSFISEARQKTALFFWALKNAKKDPAYAAKVSFFVFVVNGLYVQALKSTWATMQGRDIDEAWDWQRILLLSAASPLTGMPGYQAWVGSTGVLEAGKNAIPALKRLWSGDSAEDDRVMRDLDALMMGASMFSETAVATTGLTRLLGEAAGALDYLLDYLGNEE
jgi:predicted TIM-barrel fold metal-dependent hydrolase